MTARPDIFESQLHYDWQDVERHVERTSLRWLFGFWGGVALASVVFGLTLLTGSLLT
tara:strand:- start:848 stop:1018 length:171 start_codon:yes stop_codon:yes gene_type:complete